MTTFISPADRTTSFPLEQANIESIAIEIVEEGDRIDIKERKANEDRRRFSSLVSRITEQTARLDALTTEKPGSDRDLSKFDPSSLRDQAIRMQAFTGALQEVDTLNQQAGKAFDLFEGSARELLDESGFRNNITDRDLNDLVEQALDGLKNDWLNHYQGALGKYIEFFSEFNAIMADLHKFVDASDDGQKVNINFNAIKVSLNALIAKYQGTDGRLASFNSEADAKKFIESLGVIGLVVEQFEGKWHVKYNLGPLIELQNSMPDESKTWDMLQYNAWQSGKDSRIEELQHVSKVLGEKASRNLQIYDSVVKAFSSLVEANGQVNRDIVSNF